MLCCLNLTWRQMFLAWLWGAFGKRETSIILIMFIFLFFKVTRQARLLAADMISSTFSAWIRLMVGGWDLPQGTWRLMRTGVAEMGRLLLEGFCVMTGIWCGSLLVVGAIRLLSLPSCCLRLILSKGLLRVMVESDSFQAINLIHNYWFCPPVHRVNASWSTRSCPISFVPRSSNNSADIVSKLS